MDADVKMRRFLLTNSDNSILEKSTLYSPILGSDLLLRFPSFLILGCEVFQDNNPPNVVCKASFRSILSAIPSLMKIRSGLKYRNR